MGRDFAIRDKPNKNRDRMSFNKPPLNILVAAAIMVIFGLAEVATAFRRQFCGEVGKIDLLGDWRLRQEALAALTEEFGGAET